MNKILSKGFDDRMIMFADKDHEAIRYAKSYSSMNNDTPYLIGLKLDGLIIDYSGLSYESALELYNKGKIDGYLSDRNNLANYYVIFNTKKLNTMLHNINFKQC